MLNYLVCTLQNLNLNLTQKVQQISIAGQEKNFEFQLPSGPVHLHFSVAPTKFNFPNLGVQ